MFASALRGGGEFLDLGVVVDGHDGHLAVVAAEPEGRLEAVRGLAPHLHPADRAISFRLDDPFDLRDPLEMADADVLGDAEPAPWDDTWASAEWGS